MRLNATPSLHQLWEDVRPTPIRRTAGRLDSVETIGRAVVGKIKGASTPDIAAELDLPVTTVRDWLRRHRERVLEVERGLICWAIDMGEQVPWDRPTDVERGLR